MASGKQEWVARIAILAALEYYLASGVAAVSVCLEGALKRVGLRSGYQHFQLQINNESGWLTKDLLEKAAEHFRRGVFTGDLAIKESTTLARKAVALPAFECCVAGRKLVAYPDVVCEQSRLVIVLKCVSIQNSRYHRARCKAVCMPTTRPTVTLCNS